jgi:hypothetical protein
MAMAAVVDVVVGGGGASVVVVVELLVVVVAPRRVVAVRGADVEDPVPPPAVVVDGEWVTVVRGVTVVLGRLGTVVVIGICAVALLPPKAASSAVVIATPAPSCTRKTARRDIGASLVAGRARRPSPWETPLPTPWPG